jgi:hypothetical protein
MSGFGFNEEFVSEEITIYDPPGAKFRFPLTVGEHWQTTTIITTESSYTDPYGDSSDTETDTYESSLIYNSECLRTETIVVPAGIFETYLVYIAEGYDDPGLDGEEEEWEEEGFEGSVEVGYYSDSSGGYSVEYYSPELGYIVKTETYDENREIIMSVELVSYDHEEPGSTTSPSGGLIDFGQGFQLSNELCLILIFIVIILILTIFLMIRRRNRRLDAMVLAKYGTAQNQVQSQHPTEQTTVQQPKAILPHSSHPPQYSPRQLVVTSGPSIPQGSQRSTQQKTTTTNTPAQRSSSMTTARIQSAKTIDNQKK